MRFCPKCGELYDDQLLAFCLADGTPLGVVTPDSDVWKEGSRAFEQKQNALKTQQRKLKWRSVVLTTMLIATMAVCVAEVSRSIYVTVEPARGQLCITTFNDLNNNHEPDSGEPGVSGFVFQVRGTDSDETLTTDIDGRVCSDLPIGSYTIIAQLQGNSIATPPTAQTVTLTAGQTANLSFGSRQETELCIGRFEDLNGNGRREEDEPGLSGFVFQVSGPGVSTTLTTGQSGIDCMVIPVGTYTVVEQPQSGWVTTTDTKQTVTVTAGGAAKVLLGSKRELGNLRITTFDDSNNSRSRDAGEVGLSGFVFEVRGQSSTITLRSDPDGISSDLPVGAYTVVEQTADGWVPTTLTTQAVTIRAGRTERVSFGARRKTGQLCVTAFDDLDNDGVRDAGERGLSGFVVQVSGAGAAVRLITNANVAVCLDLPVGAYTVNEQPQGGWTATTTPTRTVTITANQTEKLFFGSRREAGQLCITTFYDRNRNSKQEKDEPGLPGIVFQVSGTVDVKTVTTDVNGAVCLPLGAGSYTIAETKQPGWSPTTSTTRNIVIKEGQKFPISFGNTKSEPECSEIDKSRERQFILNQYERNWRTRIERERERVIAAAAPQAHGKVRATLDEFEPQVVLKTCTTAFITLSYVWIVEVLGGAEKPRTERVKGHQNVACEKAGPNWICQ